MRRTREFLDGRRVAAFSSPVRSSSGICKSVDFCTVRDSRWSRKRNLLHARSERRAYFSVKLRFLRGHTVFYRLTEETNTDRSLVARQARKKLPGARGDRLPSLLKLFSMKGSPSIGTGEILEIESYNYNHGPTINRAFSKYRKKSLVTKKGLSRFL